MGTYSASKYRLARKAKTCDACGVGISKDFIYLDYRPGLRSHSPICYQCSLTVTQYGPRYRCADVENELDRITVDQGNE